jgi:hypothetical protein
MRRTKYRPIIFRVLWFIALICLVRPPLDLKRDTESLVYAGITLVMCVVPGVIICFVIDAIRNPRIARPARRGFEVIALPALNDESSRECKLKA